MIGDGENFDSSVFGEITIFSPLWKLTELPAARVDSKKDVSVSLDPIESIDLDSKYRCILGSESLRTRPILVLRLEYQLSARNLTFPLGT